MGELGNKPKKNHEMQNRKAGSRPLVPLAVDHRLPDIQKTTF